MIQKFHKPVILGVIIVLAGCDLVDKNSGTIEYNLLIETEKEEYTLGSGELVEVRLENHSGFAVYNVYPGSVIIEKRDGNEWKNLGMWYGTIGIPPVLWMIEDGDILIPAAPQLKTDNEWIFQEPGEYRFHFPIHSFRASQPDSSKLIPVEHRVSNSFMIIE